MGMEMRQVATSSVMSGKNLVRALQWGLNSFVELGHCEDPQPCFMCYLETAI